MTRAHAFRLTLLAVAVLALLLLIPGVAQMDLAPGMPFERIWQFLLDQFARGGPIGSPPPEFEQAGRFIIDLMRIVFLVALIAFPFAVILTLIDPELRKRVLKSTLRLILLLVVLSFFLRERMDEVETEAQPFGQEAPSGEFAPAEPLPYEEFQPDNIPRGLVWGLSLALGLVVAVVILTVVNQLRTSRSVTRLPLQDIEREAQSALDEIRQGGDLRDTILRCYAQMTRVVRELRGVRRDRAVTAREFTDSLIGAQLPEAPVQRLTRLFERARYGAETAKPEEEEEAIASLQAIIEACKNA